MKQLSLFPNDEPKHWKFPADYIRQEYESGRYDKEGNPLGGMYKRDYRKKKKYL